MLQEISLLGTQVELAHFVASTLHRIVLSLILFGRVFFLSSIVWFGSRPRGALAHFNSWIRQSRYCQVTCLVEHLVTYDNFYGLSTMLGHFFYRQINASSWLPCPFQHHYGLSSGPFQSILVFGWSVHVIAVACRHIWLPRRYWSYFRSIHPGRQTRRYVTLQHSNWWSAAPFPRSIWAFSSLRLAQLQSYMSRLDQSLPTTSSWCADTGAPMRQRNWTR